MSGVKKHLADRSLLVFFALWLLWAAIVVALFHPSSLSREDRQQADDLMASQRDTARDFDPDRHLKRG
jgi:hypothetical protein